MLYQEFRRHTGVLRKSADGGVTAMIVLATGSISAPTFLSHCTPRTVPSGDQTRDRRIFESPLAMRVGLLPPRSTVQTASSPLRSLKNAIRVPSGEYLGEDSKADPASTSLAS